MSDDKTKRGPADRRTVAAGEDYEVEYLATKHGLAKATVLALIAQFGNSREKLEEQIQKLKSGR